MVKCLVEVRLPLAGKTAGEQQADNEQLDSCSLEQLQGASAVTAHLTLLLLEQPVKVFLGSQCLLIDTLQVKLCQVYITEGGTSYNEQGRVVATSDDWAAIRRS